MSNLGMRLFAATLRTDLPLLDIHGTRTHEARENVGLFLSGLLEKNESAGRIVYGIGTGALREAVVAELSKRPEVATLQEETGACIIILTV